MLGQNGELGHIESQGSGGDQETGEQDRVVEIA
jgi:hypothetical protein